MKVNLETQDKLQRVSLHGVLRQCALEANWGMFPWKEFHAASGNFISSKFDPPQRAMCSVAYIGPCALGGREGTYHLLRQSTPASILALQACVLHP